MPGHNAPPKPDVRDGFPIPCMVKDMRYSPPRWGVLRNKGPRAGRVQFGPRYPKDSVFVPWAALVMVSPEELEEAKARDVSGLV